jgi:hypothetical protein
LFNNAFSAVQFHLMKRWYVNDKLEMMWKERSWPHLRYYPGIFLVWLRKTIKSSVRMDGLRAEIWTRISRIEAHRTTMFDETSNVPWSLILMFRLNLVIIRSKLYSVFLMRRYSAITSTWWWLDSMRNSSRQNKINIAEVWQVRWSCHKWWYWNTTMK